MGTPEKVSPPPLFTLQLGVWQVSMMAEKPWDVKKHAKEVLAALPLFRRLANEMYQLHPVLFTLFILAKLWTGIESALLLYLSSQILTIIERGMVRGQPDYHAVAIAIAKRVACVVCVGVIDWWTARALINLRARIQTHFELYLMKAKLRIDLPTSQEPRSKTSVTSDAAWNAFDAIINFLADVLSTGSQLALILETSRTSGDPLFALSCLLKPIAATFGRHSLYWRAHVVQTNNPHYRRMQALHQMSTDHYRAEVISSDIGDFIVREYEKENTSLGGVSDGHPDELYQQRSTPFVHVLNKLLGDLPMIYCAVMAMVHPDRFTLSSIAILQQSSSDLRWSLEYVLENSDRFRRELTVIRKLYEAEKVANMLADGERSYPNPSEEKPKGMAFELRNVSFSYPGSQSVSNALVDVSLSIKAGQLVTIVGENGSSKSTLIKLLTRMYDPASGEILIDDHKMTDYRLADLRQATSVLTQDHSIFPLSLSQNIGLGNVDRYDDKELIAEASRLGGATNCIAKLERGADTVLDPINYAYGMNLLEDDEDPLNKELKEFTKKIEVSGGERQRLVASRTFMRFSSNKIHFVAVDEPSSALDPEGEAQLFANLRSPEVREGKTMVFVTHRFGHLTKFADQIIVMKNGRVAETGTHETLLKAGGEYSKLYNIQASAFLSE